MICSPALPPCCTCCHPSFFSKYLLLTTFMERLPLIRVQKTGSVGRMTMPSFLPPLGQKCSQTGYAGSNDNHRIAFPDCPDADHLRKQGLPYALVSAEDYTEAS